MLTVDKMSYYYAKGGLSASAVSLPSSIKDAMFVEDLQLEYLWVAGLCNIQEDKAGWEIQLKTVGAIFQNAIVTIIVNGENTNSSIPGLSMKKIFEQSCVAEKA